MKLFLTSLLLLLYNFSFAQVDFSKGVLITTSGDTIPGYIRVEEKNGEVVLCQIKSSYKEVGFKPVRKDDIKTIQLSGPEGPYEIWKVSRSMTYIDKFNLEIKAEDSIRNEPIHLNLIYKGKKYSLYGFEDMRSHYFIYDGAQMTELMIMYRYYTAWDKKKLLDTKAPTYEAILIYRDQLKQYYDFSSFKKDLRILSTSRYEQQDLKRVFQIMDTR